MDRVYPVRTCIPDILHPSPVLSNPNCALTPFFLHYSEVSPTPSSTAIGLPPKTPATRSHLKKQSTGPAKSPGRGDFSHNRDDRDSDDREEVLFLGRRDDELYLCERRLASFRILRLSPLSSSTLSERQAVSLDDN